MKKILLLAFLLFQMLSCSEDSTSTVESTSIYNKDSSGFTQSNYRVSTPTVYLSLNQVSYDSYISNLQTAIQASAVPSIKEVVVTNNTGQNISVFLGYRFSPLSIPAAEIDVKNDLFIAGIKYNGKNYACNDSKSRESFVGSLYPNPIVQSNFYNDYNRNGYFRKLPSFNRKELDVFIEKVSKGTIAFGSDEFKKGFISIKIVLMECLKTKNVKDLVSTQVLKNNTILDLTSQKLWSAIVNWNRASFNRQYNIPIQDPINRENLFLNRFSTAADKAAAKIILNKLRADVLNSGYVSSSAGTCDSALELKEYLTKKGYTTGTGATVLYWKYKGLDYDAFNHTATSVFILGKEFLVDATHLQFTNLNTLDESVIILAKSDWKDEILARTNGEEGYYVDRLMSGSVLGFEVPKTESPNKPLFTPTPDFTKDKKGCLVM